MEKISLFSLQNFKCAGINQKGIKIQESIIWGKIGHWNYNTRNSQKKLNSLDAKIWSRNKKAKKCNRWE